MATKLMKYIIQRPLTKQSSLVDASWYLAKETINLVDRRFLLTSAVIVDSTQLPSFLMSLFNVTHKMADVFYVLSVVAVAITTLVLRYSYYMRQIAVTTMVTLWGLRLGSFLFYRSFYIKDWRTEELMNTTQGVFSFYIYQTLLAWMTSLPVTLLNSFSHDVMPGVVDMIGYALWGAGFLLETVADWQQFNFREKHKDRFCNIGLWRYSRHPNFLGEIMLWWGIFLCASPVFSGMSWVLAIMGPLSLTFSILFVSGIPILERNNKQKFGNDPAYQRYKAKVPLLIPAITREQVVKEARERFKKSQ
jgi:steroid 5-alpha reductase family enzyme